VAVWKLERDAREASATHPRRNLRHISRVHPSQACAQLLKRREASERQVSPRTTGQRRSLTVRLPHWALRHCRSTLALYCARYCARTHY
jgi:hypothetical protein